MDTEQAGQQQEFIDEQNFWKKQTFKWLRRYHVVADDYRKMQVQLEVSKAREERLQKAAVNVVDMASYIRGVTVCEVPLIEVEALVGVLRDLGVIDDANEEQEQEK